MTWLLRALTALAVCLLPVVSAAATDRTVLLVPDDDVELASVVLTARGREGRVVLFDPWDEATVSTFLAQHGAKARCLRRRRTPGAVVSLMESISGGECSVVSDLASLAHELWPKATRLVAAPAADYAWLLRAAAFAGATDAALLPVGESGSLKPADIEGWKLETLYLLPGTRLESDGGTRAGLVVPIESPAALDAELLRRLPAPPPTVVVANPADRLAKFSPSVLSLVAPVESAIHRSPLVLVDSSDPAEIERQVLRFIDAQSLSPTHIILVGDELALRSHRVPDPVLAAGGPESIGGGAEVRVEIFSRIEEQEPQDFAVGRIAAESSAQASVVLAGQVGPPRKTRKKPVAVLSNADEVFSLGEAISRATVNELRNVGVQVNAHFRGEVTPAVIAGALRGSDLLVWEGHARDLTLEQQGGLTTEEAPSFVVLQGCYTLDRSDPFILMQHGTVAIVATSAAIYSASGSAFAKALFDALLYDGADLGTAVRDARNYLLALTKLKRRRGHEDWHKTYRAALAFALWGDPTIRPKLAPRRPKVKPVRWQLGEGEIELSVGPGRLSKVEVDRFHVRPVPRAMLGGLILKKHDGSENRELKELFFTVQQGGEERSVACPPSGDWETVSLFAPRTRTLTLLARANMLDRTRTQRVAFPLAPRVEACEADGSATPAVGGVESESGEDPEQN
jgi:hypothetical protein